MRTELVRETRRQSLYAVLRRHVVRLVRRTLKSCDGADEHDRAARASFDHAGNDSLGGGESTDKVDAEDPVPVVGLQLGGRALGRDASVRHEYVDATEHLGRLGD